MQCNAFQKRLDDLLDHRRPPHSDRALMGHAECCEPCDKILRANILLLGAVQEVSPRYPDSEQPLPLWRPFASYASYAAVAATLLIACGWWFRLPMRPEPHSLSISVVETALPAEAPTVVDTPLPPPQASFVYQPLIGLSLLSRADWRETIDGVNMPFGARLPEIQTAWKVVTDGMTPVQQSMNGTLDLIRRSFSPAPRDVVNG